jgi:K+-transporting ATPase c subunit
MAYPLVIWAIGQAVFPEQANGVCCAIRRGPSSARG